MRCLNCSPRVAAVVDGKNFELSLKSFKKLVLFSWSLGRISVQPNSCQLSPGVQKFPVANLLISFKGVFFRRIQKRIFDPRFARFCGRKKRKFRNSVGNLGILS